MNHTLLSVFTQVLRSSVLAWPAWLRVLAIAPLLVLLWLGVYWARLETAPL